MKITGERPIPASRQTVWNALNDPDILRNCIPGCDEMEKVSDTEYRLGMLAVVGPVKARFAGKLQMADITAPERYSLRFEGAGGAAGFGKGAADVALTAVGDTQTQLAYTAEAQVGGKIAQVGSRLIDGIARKIAEEFFTRFETALSGPTTAEEPAGAGQRTGGATAGAAAGATAAPAPDLRAAHDVREASATRPTPQQKKGNRMIGWLAGAIVVIVAIAALAWRHSS